MEMVIKRQRELRKNRKKGFTLVELIVVIVILAILAAIAVPALTGYIDKARIQGLESQARTAAVAARTVVSDAYGTGYFTTPDGTTVKVASTATPSAQNWVDIINAYAAGTTFVDSTSPASGKVGLTVTIVAGAKPTLTSVAVNDGTKTVTYTDATGEYVVS